MPTTASPVTRGGTTHVDLAPDGGLMVAALALAVLATPAREVAA